jgi:hypothetical protein
MRVASPVQTIDPRGGGGMNLRRVAEIHVEIAKLHQELAEAMAPDDAVASLPAARPIRKVRVHPAPLAPPNDIDVARASRMLRRRGVTT